MFKQRLYILLALFAAALGGMLVRAGYMQMVQGDFYRAEAAKALESVRLLPGQRGRILDRNGVILAEDEACYDFCLDYRFLTDDPRWKKARIREILKAESLDASLPEDLHRAETLYLDRVENTWAMSQQICNAYGWDLDDQIAKIKRSVNAIRQAVGRDVREQRLAHVVAPGIEEARALLLRPRMKNTLGAVLRPSHRRRYPYKNAACHIIGVTGPIFREDAAKHNLTPTQANWLTRMRSNYLHGDTIGKMGAERMCESHLRAKRGYNQYSAPGELVATVPPKVGMDVRLTIDIDLQQRLMELFARSGYNGSIVVIDVPTGEVLSMVSWPTYDLNRYRTDYASLVETVRAKVNRPLLHRAIGGQFEPGSTVKPITGLAGLIANKMTVDELINCPGYVYKTPAGKSVLRCWKRSGHGELALIEAIKRSCTVYFPKVGGRLGLNELNYWQQLFGFGLKPGTGLPEERAGVLGTTAYLQRVEDRTPYPSDAWFEAVGQGVFAATPLQVANAHAALARGGRFLSPIVVRPGPPQQRNDLPVVAEHIAAIHEGMHRVIHESGGTANKAWRFGMPLPFDSCGKTGTAQTASLRIDTDGDGKREAVRSGDHSWFAGFAPYGPGQKPQIAISVIVEYAGSGGTYAAPIAKDVFRLCDQLGYVRGGR